MVQVGGGGGGDTLSVSVAPTMGPWGRSDLRGCSFTQMMLGEIELPGRGEAGWAGRGGPKGAKVWTKGRGWELELQPIIFHDSLDGFDM